MPEAHNLRQTADQGDNLTTLAQGSKQTRLCAFRARQHMALQPQLMSTQRSLSANSSTTALQHSMQASLREMGADRVEVFRSE